MDWLVSNSSFRILVGEKECELIYIYIYIYIHTTCLFYDSTVVLLLKWWILCLEINSCRRFYDCCGCCVLLQFLSKHQWWISNVRCHWRRLCLKQFKCFCDGYSRIYTSRFNQRSCVWLLQFFMLKRALFVSHHMVVDLVVHTPGFLHVFWLSFPSNATYVLRRCNHLQTFVIPSDCDFPANCVKHLFEKWISMRIFQSFSAKGAWTDCYLVWTWKIRKHCFSHKHRWLLSPCQI